MGRLCDYTASDLEGKAHRGALRLDLQQIELPDASLDLVLTAHTLEHVPDPDTALRELHRVLAPGGSVLLQVPLTQAATERPRSPEYHGDDTLVHWRFGWDIAERARAAGFRVTTLVTADLLRRVRGQDPWGYVGDVDSDSLLTGARGRLAEMRVVADDTESTLLWLDPSFYFVAWLCQRGGR